MITKENYFEELSKLGLELDKKLSLSYASWSEVWSELKKNVKDAKYEWIENSYGTLGLVDDYGCWAKVRVYSEYLGVDVTQYLQVMDPENQSIKKDRLDTNSINKTYQRCMVKAIAVGFGLGLYVYRGEDLPDDIETDGSENKKVDPSEYKVQESNMLNKPIFNDGKTIGQKVSEFKKIMEPYTKECKSCGTLIPDKVYEFKNLGLCFKCQKKHLDNQEKVTQEKILQKEIEDTKKDEEFGSDMNDFIRN